MGSAPDQLDPAKGETLVQLVTRFFTSLLIAGAILCVCFLAIFGTMAWRFNRPPFSLDLLKQLDGTMTATDVRQVLGAPVESWVRTDAEGREYEEWAYQSSGSWSIVYIYFTPDGKFSESVYDY